MSEEKKLMNEVTFGDDEGEDMFEEDDEKHEQAEIIKALEGEDAPDVETYTATEILIPLDRVEEFKFLSKGNYCQVLCAGVMTERGMVVQDIKYKR